jgi:AAA family ATP:ADP antiporter
LFKNILYKTFGLRDGEIAISFLMQLYIFIIITVLLIVKPTVNALFLNKLGADNLPYAYLLVAFVAILTTHFYNKILKNNTLVKVAIYALIVFSATFLLLSIILHFNIINHFVLYFYYLFVSLFAVIATSQFWMFANMVFNTREAKRLFGFIGAGAIAGGIFGGYLTSIIAASYGNKAVMLMASLLILINIPVLRKIYKLRLRKLNLYDRKTFKSNASDVNDSTLRLILKSKHLTYLALITGISVIVAKLVDFQFSDIANRSFKDSDSLASFFGFWFSTFNVIALSIQLLLTNKILTKFGVSTTLLFLPIGVALGCLLFLTFPELWVLVIIKGLDGSFKQSLNKAAFELSIMPIPLAVKNQAKSFIDVAVDSIATGIAGFLLIFLIRKLNLPTSYITVIIIFFVLIWILLIFKLREAYYNSFRENIKQTLVKSNTKKGFKLKRETTILTSQNILNSGDEEDILVLLDRINSVKLKALKSQIINLLDHPSHRVKKAAIHQLYNYDKNTAIEEVEGLLNIEDDALIYSALEYLLHHTYKNDKSIFNRYLNHKNDYLSNAILLCLAKDAKNNYSLAKYYNLEKRIETQVSELSTPEGFTRKESIAELLITISYSGISKFYSFIAVHFNNKDVYIVNHAIKAAGITKDERFIPNLLQFLKDKDHRKIALKALKNYGIAIAENLLIVKELENLDDDIKKNIPKLIQSFKSQNSLKLLYRLLKQKDVSIRVQTIIALSKLKEKAPELYINNRIIKTALLKECKFYKNTLSIIASLTITLEQSQVSDKNTDNKTEILIARQSIVDILKEQEQQSLKCIFKLLSILYNQSDIEMSYNGILSDIKEAKINALEFLDNLLQNQLKTNIFPLLEYYVIKDEEDKTSLKLKNLSERNYLNLLVKSRGKRLKLEVVNLVFYLNEKNYAPIIKPLLKHKNSDVKYLSFKTLNKLTGLTTT